MYTLKKLKVKDDWTARKGHYRVIVVVGSTMYQVGKQTRVFSLAVDQSLSCKYADRILIYDEDRIVGWETKPRPILKYLGPPGADAKARAHAHLAYELEQVVRSMNPRMFKRIGFKFLVEIDQLIERLKDRAEGLVEEAVVIDVTKNKS